MIGQLWQWLRGLWAREEPYIAEALSAAAHAERETIVNLLRELAETESGHAADALERAAQAVRARTWPS